MSGLLCFWLKSQIPVWSPVWLRFLRRFNKPSPVLKQKEPEFRARELSSVRLCFPKKREWKLNSTAGIRGKERNASVVKAFFWEFFQTVWKVKWGVSVKEKVGGERWDFLGLIEMEESKNLALYMKFVNAKTCVYGIKATQFSEVSIFHEFKASCFPLVKQNVDLIPWIFYASLSWLGGRERG